MSEKEADGVVEGVVEAVAEEAAEGWSKKKQDNRGEKQIRT